MKHGTKIFKKSTRNLAFCTYEKGILIMWRNVVLTTDQDTIRMQEMELVLCSS